MKTKAILLLFTTVFYPLINSISASNNESGSPLVTNYNSATYKAHPQNWGIIQDDRGLMYFANGDGVLVYDGNSWELIGLPNKNPARVFGKDQQGLIYVAGPNEIGYLQPNNLGKLGYVSLIDSLGISNIGIVREILTADSCIYFRTEDYVIRLNSKGFSHWKARSMFAISFLFNNNFFVQDDDFGLFMLKNDSLTLAPSGNEFIKKTFYVAKQLDSEVILANRAKGLYRYEPNSKKEVKLTHIASEANKILIDEFVFSGIVTQEKEIILGTNSAGCVIVNRNGEIISRINRETGILQNKVHGLFIDRDDVLWLALDKGISRCDYSGPITFWNQQHGLEGTLQTLTRFNETLYIGTLQGFYYLTNGKIHKFQKGISQTWSLLKYSVPKTGIEKLLVGTVEGIFVLENGVLVNVPNTPVAYKLYQSPLNPNIVYFGSIENTGVLEFEDGNFYYKGLIPNTGNNVRSVVQENDGEIWLSTFRDGVIRITPSDDILNPQNIDYYSLSSGLPSLKNILIYRLNGEMVFATENGLYRYDRELNKFSPDKTLGSIYKKNLKDVFAFIEDPFGGVYLSQLMNTHGSMGYAAKQPDGSYSWSSEAYNKLPAMMMLVTYLEQDSILWVGGSEGLFKINQSKHRKSNNQFHTLIRRVSISNDSCIFYGNYFSKKME